MMRPYVYIALLTGAMSPTTNSARSDISVTLPKASFVANCASSSSYTLDATSSQRGSGGPLVQYRWTLPSGAVRTMTPTTTASWSVGKFVVKLSVVDSSGKVSSVVQKTLTLPCVAPIKPETVTVQLPPRVDTLTRVDTLIRTVVVRDTIAYAVTLPVGLPSRSGLYVDSAQVGQPIRFFRMCLLGMGSSGRRGVALFWNNGLSAAPNNAATITGFFPQVGVLPSVDAAGVALDSLKIACP